MFNEHVFSKRFYPVNDSARNRVREVLRSARLSARTRRTVARTDAHGSDLSDRRETVSGPGRNDVCTCPNERTAHVLACARAGVYAALGGAQRAFRAHVAREKARTWPPGLINVLAIRRPLTTCGRRQLNRSTGRAKGTPAEIPVLFVRA